jgi:hypothetical protein
MTRGALALPVIITVLLAIGQPWTAVDVPRTLSVSTLLLSSAIENRDESRDIPPRGFAPARKHCCATGFVSLGVPKPVSRRGLLPGSKNCPARRTGLDI